MDALLTLLPILGVLVVGIISPGPSFILVARTAVAISRVGALASAAGMATGAALLATAALLGLHALLLQLPGTFTLLKIVGGLYLFYLAFQTWRGAGRPVLVAGQVEPQGGGLARHFALALGTMVSNPKAAVQYGVLFSAMLPASPTRSVMQALPIAVFLLEASWYTIVALSLSAPRTRNAYLRQKLVVDRVAGALLAAIGLRLLFMVR